MTPSKLPPKKISHLSRPKYRADIDGLRAVAVLSVVAFHAFPELVNAGFITGGFIGVDVFFVISGFLISTIIFENLDRGTFNFTEFYSRRIIRIFPALLLILIASYAFGWFALLSIEYKQLGKHIVAGAGFVSNFSLLDEAGYFDNASETKPLLHLWSLGIEEQFYILWPLLLWAAWKRKFNLLTISILIFTVSFYLNIKGVKKDVIATFYSPQTRTWELICGAVLAWISLYQNDLFSSFKIKIDSYLASIMYREKPTINGNALSNVLSFLGISILMYGFWRITKNFNYPGKWALIPVIGTALIISAGPAAWINRIILSNKIVVWFGLISFPLYLWHWPLLSFSRIVEGELPALSIRIAVLFLSIILAWFTYKFIERPMRLAKNSKTVTMLLVFFMLIVGYVGYNSYANDGLGFRIKDNKSKVAVHELFANPLPKINDFDCSKFISEFTNIEFDMGCKLSKNEPPTIMFIGDSHAYHFKFAAWNKLTSDSILMLANTSCLPFSGDHFMVGDCEKKYSAILGYLENNSSIKTVILSGYWAYLMTGGFEETGVNWRKAKPLTEEGVRTFKANAYTFISRVLKSGKKIIFLKDIPDLDFDIYSCFDSRPFRFAPLTTLRKDCSMDEVGFIHRAAPYDTVINEILYLFPDVKIYNPRPLFCQNGKCFGSNGTLPYYFDGDHVNQFGASLVIDGLLDETGRLP